MTRAALEACPVTALSFKVISTQSVIVSCSQSLCRVQGDLKAVSRCVVFKVISTQSVVVSREASLIYLGRVVQKNHKSIGSVMFTYRTLAKGVLFVRVQCNVIGGRGLHHRSVCPGYSVMPVVGVASITALFVQGTV